MTDIINAPDITASTNSDERNARIKQRYRAERRFKMIGLSAIVASIAFLVFLLFTITQNGIPAFTYHHVTLPVDATNIDRDKFLEQVEGKKRITANFKKVASKAILDQAPYLSGRKNRKLVRGLLSDGVGLELREAFLNNEALSAAPQEVEFLVSDFTDLYLKGLTAKPVLSKPDVEITASTTEGEVEITAQDDAFAGFLKTIEDHLTKEIVSNQAPLDELKLSLLTQQGIIENSKVEANVTRAQDAIGSLEYNIQTQQAKVDALIDNRDAIYKGVALDTSMPSLLIRMSGGVVKVNELSASIAKGDVIIPLESTASAAGNWVLQAIAAPEDDRKFKDKEVIVIDQLNEAGLIRSKFNSILFSNGDSREPELAGVWGAVVGSFFTMLITLALSFPLGVAAAIYLEEFAPKNKFTDLIEVNINNLAAVPSIVFGLLGLAVFLNFFGLPRSAPLVGGMVLALMTLPTIIIAARTALKSVPPSIREAALGVGSSKLQAVFHHVLPLAIPGILTGAIIGMARALGETAPLLMIGMFAFVVDIPEGITSSATVLPVQVFIWADAPEPGFQQKTAAAIMVLLVFLMLMNALAVFLRKRFERRW